MLNSSVVACAALVCIMTLTTIPLSTAQNDPQSYLSPQNTARAEVGVGPLVWDDTIAAYAQSYAGKRVGDCNLVHSNGPYGENIFWGSSTTFVAADAIKSWVDEKSYYDYASNSCTSGQQCLHYTQVVWQNSVRLGCARVDCNAGGVFIICNYDPRGNIIGERPY